MIGIVLQLLDFDIIFALNVETVLLELFPSNPPQQGSLSSTACQIISCRPLAESKSSGPLSKILAVLVTGREDQFGPGFVAGLLDGLKSQGALGIKNVSRTRRRQQVGAAGEGGGGPGGDVAAEGAAACWELQVEVETSSEVEGTGKEVDETPLEAAAPSDGMSDSASSLKRLYVANDMCHEVRMLSLQGLEIEGKCKQPFHHQCCCYNHPVLHPCISA